MSRYKAYPDYKDSGVEWIGDIPTHWNVTRLKRVISKLESGVSVNAFDTPAHEGEVGVLKTSCVYTRSFRPFENKTVVLDELSRVKCPVKKGAIIVSRMNTPDLVGASALVNSDVKNLYLPDRLWQIIFRKNFKISPEFVAYFMMIPDFRAQISLAAEGASSSMQNIAKEDYLAIHFAQPVSYEEQCEVVAFLDHETAKIDALIEKQQRLIELLKEKRQAVISHAVTKGLNPNAPMKDSGVEWLGEVPAHWNVSRIKNIAQLESGHTPDKKIEEYWIDCNIPWVSLNDSTQLKAVDYITDTAFYLSDKGIANSSARKLPARCVVFTRDASIGLAAITTRVMAVSQHVIAWICDEEKVIPEYLLLVFYAMKDELERYTFGATLKTIGMADVKKLVGVFPSISEQKSIVENVFVAKEKFDFSVSKVEAAIQLSKERRTALISAAVTGKIDVRDWQAAA
ncbi:restriction endonuclease subunit S [Comamonas testosteroni]|uniref:restriction endonuclease subunit S n=1 Tax=Comamonas testosteroni TaxID=285 RepID=UPI0026EBA577|nr:restriction endonuclease subunit S [Comamonas testosteroni]WQD40919.1 restriction endonuclease subunit S [Comamonas testosteroni]